MTGTRQQLATITLETSFWTWQGYKIQYTVKGTGRPLVLVHGFGASIGHWRKNIPVLAAAGYRVFALDLLGFGGSEKAPIDYTIELWVELLKDFWQEHIQESAVFIGNSIGALISLMVVAKHPEIAAGGVLINSAGGLSHRPHELNPVLGMVMGAFNRVVRSPITGKFIFNRIPQLQKRLCMPDSHITVNTVIFFIISPEFKNRHNLILFFYETSFVFSTQHPCHSLSRLLRDSLVR